MDLAGKRFLLVGGAGFIGSHLAEALLREDVAEVLVFDDFSRGSRENLAAALADPRCRVFPLGGNVLHRDLLQEAMRGVHGVFHLAALWLLHCWDFPRAAFEVNVAGTFNVLEACVAAGVERLVLSSSASVYGDARAEPMTEDHPFDDTTFYGATKLAGERMARALHHRHRDDPARGLDYVALRYMNVYGPRQDYLGAYVAVVMKMLDRIERGEPPLVHGAGDQGYDFIHVADVAAANVCAMRAEVSDRCFNVGTGRKTTLLELARLVLEAAGSDLGVEHAPADRTFVRSRVGCPERAARELGFRARIELREGLASLVAWRRAHQAELAARRARADA